MSALDVRIVRPHGDRCDGRWKLDGRWTRGGEDIATECCDRIARPNNGGRVYFVMCCTASFRCEARAYLRKGAVHEFATRLLEEAAK